MINAPCLRAKRGEPDTSISKTNPGLLLARMDSTAVAIALFHATEAVAALGDLLIEPLPHHKAAGKVQNAVGGLKDALRGK